MLSIEDLTFDVADATLDGKLVDGKLLWSVSVTTAPKTIGGQTWKPHAYLDDYPAPSRSFGDLMEDGWTIPSARELSGGRLLAYLEYHREPDRDGSTSSRRRARINDA